ncbi:hypothetical protein [Snuella lapsa]
MKRQHLYILLGIGLIITIFGIVTGKFFFLFLVIPLGFGFFRKNNDKDT